MGTSNAKKNDEFSEINSRALTAQEKLNKIYDLLETVDSNSKKDEFGYMAPNLAKLTRMLAECEQYDLDIQGEPVMVDRIFRTNRVVPKWIMETERVNYVMLGGVFVQLPCYLLPADRVNEAWKHMPGRRTKFASVINPEKYGLPGDDKVNYGTLQYIGEGCYVALAKIPISTTQSYLVSAKHITYVVTKN